MTTLLSDRDMQRLHGVHPDLVKLVTEARSHLSFFVLEGMRTYERQVQLVASGASRTMNSRHLTGHAVDLMPWVDANGNHVIDRDEINWSNWGLFAAVAKAMKEASQTLGIPIEWGGDWVGFKDGPHFQLPWGTYPA